MVDVEESVLSQVEGTTACNDSPVLVQLRADVVEAGRMNHIVEVAGELDKTDVTAFSEVNLEGTFRGSDDISGAMGATVGEGTGSVEGT